MLIKNRSFTQVDYGKKEFQMFSENIGNRTVLNDR